MATFTAHKAFDTTRIPGESGQGTQVLAATPTTWRIADTAVDSTYTGSGLEYVAGDATAGVIDGWALASQGTPLFTLTGVTFPAGPHPGGLAQDIWDIGYLGHTGHPVFREQADLAYMLRGDDILHGSDAADHIAGFEGDDRVSGNAGNDVLRGWMGNDVIDGGAGIDIAGYLGSLASATVARSADGWTVQGGTLDGSDALVAVERLVFDGGQGLALDLDGHAGMVARIIGAVFGAAAVTNRAYVGLGLQFSDAGMTYEDLCLLATQAAGRSSPADVVAALWSNIVGAPIPAAEQAHFVGLLASGMSIGALTAMAADTPQNQSNIQLTGLAATGLAFQYQGSLGF